MARMHYGYPDVLCVANIHIIAWKGAQYIFVEAFIAIILHENRVRILCQVCITVNQYNRCHYEKRVASKCAIIYYNISQSHFILSFISLIFAINNYTSFFRDKKYPRRLIIRTGIMYVIRSFL